MDGRCGTCRHWRDDVRWREGERFRRCHLLPATGDRTPCVWVENRRVVNLDTGDPITLDYAVQRGEPRSFVNGIPRIGEQKGGKAA